MGAYYIRADLLPTDDEIAADAFAHTGVDLRQEGDDLAEMTAVVRKIEAQPRWRACLYESATHRRIWLTEG